jgi:hypothetical protein
VTVAPDDAIKAAASVARDAAEGRLSPAALQEPVIRCGSYTSRSAGLCWHRREFLPTR